MADRHAVLAGIIFTVVGAIVVNPTLAAGISVPAGGSLSLGDGNAKLDVVDRRYLLTCGDLVIAGEVSISAGNAAGINDVEISGGTLNGGSGTASLAGDWSNAGTFNAGTGLVQISDGCGSVASNISGDSDFHEFSVTTSIGKLLTMVAGSSQTFASSLTLEGMVGNLLQVRSSSPGQEVFFSLMPGGAQSISAVDVRDNNASGGLTLAPGAPGLYQSVDSGNNTNWFVGVLEELFRDGFESL